MSFTLLRRCFLIPDCLRKPFSLRDQCHFASQLATLLNAGLPLLHALILLRQSAPAHWHPFLLQLETQLRQGNAFSACLRQALYPLDHSFIGLVEVSERSGQLSQALDSIATKLTTQMELRQQIQQALAYPCITVASALFLFLVMAFWVIPIFRDVFAQFQAELPWATQALLYSTSVLRRYFLTILLLLSALIFLWIVAWHRLPRLQNYCDRMWMRIPLLGELLRLSALSFWCRTLGHLLSAEIPLLDALRITARSSNHWLTHDLSANIFTLLAQGWPLGEAILRADSHYRYFDRQTWQIICIGSESGALPAMLLNRASTLSQQLNQQLKLFSRNLEPVLIALVGLLIGGLVLILYLPIFNLGQIV
ncbi:type II secretion system F family protein [Polynucleobacter sp. IMCC 29146]|uniref:type II secretion system F family protein n=1 Tax=Polynucleobacter sp. IMCC 29146 TaxID=2780953 RepID=UPI001F4762DD|nr:type II secretion system F family protein [Polynucleobacter sp. IMCC 29146]MCE7528453.1 type II secretion system F family protein [Polynucleobacter sp. IMCC 29146]